MGKVLSGPKAPSVQYIVQNPTSSATVADTSSTVSEATTSDTSQTEGEVSSEIRTASLLRRSRGRLGTISTSFRGFLDHVGDTARKTLLGE